MSNGLTLPLRYTTTCKLCELRDGKRVRVAESSALNIPLVGQPGKRTDDLMRILGKHLTKNHSQIFAQGLALFQEFQAFLILSAFEHEDPSLSPRLELIRAAIFQQVRKNTMEDAMIEHIVAGFGLDTDEAGKVNQAMKALRDACCEFGTYAPKVPEEAPRLVRV